MADPARPEEVDIEFNLWQNSRQPIQQILRCGANVTTPNTLLAIREELHQAFVHGYARGCAAEAARQPPDPDPRPGLTT